LRQPSSSTRPPAGVRLNQIGRWLLERPPIDAALDSCSPAESIPSAWTSIPAQPELWPSRDAILAYRDRVRAGAAEDRRALDPGDARHAWSWAP
jgi:hypothetical protein